MSGFGMREGRSYHRCEVRIQCLPGLRAVGAKHGADAQQRATLAWLALLGASAEHDCGGRLRPELADVTFLSTFAPAMTASEIRAALEHLVEVGLVALEAGGFVTIAGRGESWRAGPRRQHREPPEANGLVGAQ